MQTIPYNEEFEKAVILSALSDPQVFPKISALLESTDFYKVKHQEIFAAMSSVDADNLDSLAVQDKLKTETATYFKDLVSDSERLLPSTSNALYYAETVKSKAQLRAGIELGQQIIATCYQEGDAEEAIHSLEEMFAEFLAKKVLEDKSETSIDAFHKFIQSLQSRLPEDPTAIRTGYEQLDLIIQRMEGLTVLGARPGVGKTALGVNIAVNVAKKSHPVLFFSLEQPTDQIFERMVSAESGVPLEEVRLGVFRSDEDATAKIEKAQYTLSHLMSRFHIDDKAAVDTKYITSVARQKKFEWGELGLIVVDYLHIMKLGKGEKVDTLGDAVKELRGLGKELSCPVLLLAQLRRPLNEGKQQTKRPDLEDLRSSGEIEQSADMVWFLYRESYYEEAGMAPEEDVMEIIVRKNRNGRQGTVEIEWLPTIMKFQDQRRR
jgi:replicative DNA helicase